MASNSDHDPSTLREYAATFVAVAVVMAYATVGFLQMGIVVWRGIPVTIPGEWNAAMLSLSSTAMGYLFGKAPSAKRTSDTPPPTVNAAPDATITVTPASEEPK